VGVVRHLFVNFSVADSAIQWFSWPFLQSFKQPSTDARHQPSYGPLIPCSCWISIETFARSGRAVLLESDDTPLWEAHLMTLMFVICWVSVWQRKRGEIQLFQIFQLWHFCFIWNSSARGNINFRTVKTGEALANAVEGSSGIDARQGPPRKRANFKINRLTRWLIPIIHVNYG